MSALPKRIFTQEEYAMLEEHADYRSQYVAGEIFAMAGVQPWHLEVVSNLSGMFYNRFRGRRCRAYVNEARVRVRAGELWTYPDLVAFCGEPKFDKSANPYSLLNPQVIFEVLSPSTEDFDRGRKVRALQTHRIPDRLRPRRLRDDAGGTLRPAGRRRVALPRIPRRRGPPPKLASVEAELPLAEIYERVTFPAPGEGV